MVITIYDSILHLTPYGDPCSLKYTHYPYPVAYLIHTAKHSVKGIILKDLGTLGTVAMQTLFSPHIST